MQFFTERDPFLALLKWVMTELMRIEAEAKVGAAEEKHADTLRAGRMNTVTSGRTRCSDSWIRLHELTLEPLTEL